MLCFSSWPVSAVGLVLGNHSLDDLGQPCRVGIERLLDGPARIGDSETFSVLAENVRLKGRKSRRWTAICVSLQS